MHKSVYFGYGDHTHQCTDWRTSDTEVNGRGLPHIGALHQSDKNSVTQTCLLKKDCGILIAPNYSTSHYIVYMTYKILSPV
jgi:hypothetical protein